MINRDYNFFARPTSEQQTRLPMLHHVSSVRPSHRVGSNRLGILLVAGLLALAEAGCTLAPGSKPAFKSSNVLIGTGLSLGDSDYARQMALQLSDRQHAIAP